MSDAAVDRLSGQARLSLERPADQAAVEALIDRAFGPGRFAKTAERLREGAQMRRDLSFAAWDGDSLVGCVRLWRVRIGEAPALFLGPFAVEAAWRGRGLGAALIVRACQAATQAVQAGGDGRAVLLVGDAPYFAPLGFAPVPPGRIRLPGPVDPRRILLRPLTPEGEAVSGVVVV